MIDWTGRKIGNYQLKELLGQGGFADVYLGEHIYLQTPAAIKVLRAQLNEDALANFLTEARIIARLTHPHIVPVLEFGIEHTTPYLVMGYAPYGSLRKRHPHGSILPAETILSYVKQMAQALQYAHDNHIIHRDVKPENMLLGNNRVLMLSDFGIATGVQTHHTSLSQHGHDETFGTTPYMAPEVFNSQPAVASDQYALAIVVYEWFSGAPPFKGSTMLVAMQHLYDAPPPLRTRIPALAAAIEQVLLQALAKDPQQRFASIQDFAAALEKACTAEPALHTFSKPLFLPTIQPHILQEGAPSGLLTREYAPTPTTGKALSNIPLREIAPVYNLPATGKVLPPVPEQQLAPQPISRRQVFFVLGAAGLAVTSLAAFGTEVLSYNLSHHTAQPTTVTAHPTAAATPDLTPTPIVTVPSIVNTASSRPAPISSTAGSLTMFVRGGDNNLWYSTYNANWSTWTALSDSIVYDPVAASWGPGRFDLAVRGSDNSVQHQWYDGSWHAWESLSGLVTSNPAIASWGPGQIDVFARGADYALWHISYNGTWQSWESLGSGFSSSPTVVSWGAQRLDVFVRGYNNDLGHIWYDGSWQSWERLGGSFTSDPAVTSPAQGVLDVFVIADDSSLQHIRFDGGWQPWESLGGTLTSAPAAASWGNGRIDVFARGSNNALQHIWYDGSWQPWETLS